MAGGNTTKHVLRCHDKSKTSIVVQRNTLPILLLANIHATIYNIDRRKVNEQRRAVKRTIYISCLIFSASRGESLTVCTERELCAQRQNYTGQ